MKEKIVRFFGLKGSWKWAVRQMLKGEMVTQKRVTGALKYRFSKDEQNRLEWNFNRLNKDVKWENAYFFYSDLMATDWIIFKW